MDKKSQLTWQDSQISEAQHEVDKPSFLASQESLCEEMTLAEVCQLLEISLVTGRNWVKLKKLAPLPSNGTKLYFSKMYIHDLLAKFSEEQNQSLKKRRNKKQVTGCTLYGDYLDNSFNLNLIETLAQEETAFTREELNLLLANFALQSFYQTLEYTIPSPNLVQGFLHKKFSVGVYDVLIWDLLGSSTTVSERIKTYLDNLFYHQEFLDNLGFAYISLRCISDRKSKGVYYTPSKTTVKLLEELKHCTQLRKCKTLDPCCGTGNFLLSLGKEGLSLESIHGYDIDPISIALTRINLALHYLPEHLNILYENFRCVDTLKESDGELFDLIIGNPPWGYSYTSHETAFFKENYHCGKEKSLESYDLFLERALQLTHQNSIIAFVLPEAILTVKSHQTVREKLMKHCSISFVSQLGNIFSGVQCPTILLGLQKNQEKSSSTKGCRVSTPSTSFQITENRPLSPTQWSIFTNDLEYSCLLHLDSLSQTLTLKGNAEFALGIVTGDNKKLLSTTPTEHQEGILKGSDIRKYRYNPPKHYISFQPDTFQQVAQNKFYRAPERLLYRFISDTLVFAYDNQQTLSLNSCNILIPQLENHDIKYVLAILNSSVAHFYNKKKFDSVKILKSHLESIPIPTADRNTQDKIVTLVDSLCQGTADVSRCHKELQKEIAQLYQLDPVQIEMIEAFAKKGNIFLPDEK